jgi:hypothetical protein
MVSIGSLWAAILLSAVIVFVLSALIWMVMPWHKSDFKGLADEEAVRGALGGGLAPGLYNIPHAATRAEIGSAEMKKKYEDGPIAMVTVLKRGVPSMGGNMLKSFVFYLFVGVLCAYLSSRTLDFGTSYLQVYRVTGCIAWTAYGLAAVQDGIWFGRPWSQVWKILLDALIYGLFTGGVFGWLWPR